MAKEKRCLLFGTHTGIYSGLEILLILSSTSQMCVFVDP